METTPAIGRMTLYSARLVEYIKASTAEVLTDEELTKACGKDTRVGCDGYPYLATALNHLRNNGIVWGRIPRANCIKRLTTTEKHEKADGTRRHVHKQSKRALQIVQTIDVSTLTDAERKVQLVNEAQLGVLCHMSNGSMRRKLEARNVATEIDPAKLLEAMVKP